MKPVYKRLVLKVSGQSLAGEQGFGISTPRIQQTSQEILEVVELGVQLGAARWTSCWSQGCSWGWRWCWRRGPG